MKHLSALASLLIACSAHAQITITAADMPSAGDTLRYSTDAVTTFDGADTGPNHIWDYSQLLSLAQNADTCVTVGSTPILYQFFFNNPFIYPNYDADYAMKGTDFGFQGLTVADVYDYYKKGSGGFRNVGFGATINGLPASVQRTPIDYIYRFPMDYGNIDSSASAFNLSVPTIMYYGQSQMRYNEVDGWGTLYLPADTFDVLRVKSRLVRTDTIYIDQFGFGFTLPEPETIEYKWVAAGMGQPVLQVTTLAGIPTTTRFFYEPDAISTGIVPATTGIDATVYPNPAHDQVFISLPDESTGELLVIDATGREVRRQHVQRSSATRIDLGGLPNGTYGLRLVGDAPWSGKLVIDRP